MKKFWQTGLAVLCFASLGGCFVSTTALIEEGAAVLPVDGDMVACLKESDPCLSMQRDGDGYFVESPSEFEEGVTIRFSPLAQAAGRQVYLAEAELTGEDGPAFAYGLVRRRIKPSARGATIEAAPLDCEDASAELLDAFEAEGGEVENGKLTSCMPVSLEQLKALILAVHGSDIESDAWWLERGEDF